MKRSLVTAAALAIGLAAAIPAAAQSFGQGPGQGRGMHMAHGGWGGGPMGGGFARMCANSDARIAAMLAYAETRLKITEQQRGAWNSFAEAVRSGDQPIQQACQRLQADAQAGQAGQPAPLPERLDRMETMLSAGLETLKRVQPALDTLYAQLTPEQKQIADGMMQHRGMRGGMHGSMRGGMPGGMPGGMQGGPTQPN